MEPQNGPQTLRGPKKWVRRSQPKGRMIPKLPPSKVLKEEITGLRSESLGGGRREFDLEGGSCGLRKGKWGAAISEK